ncbi:hypothetical protein BS47DRAFT_1393815 [Hydnum rufescens UP504]|uniref:G domain-containing protein n=1 Tax=Hydnum rufescens UP504 TaxID=1448309 RepID=A0A9P6DWM7_9AGAM|nr:hypothetical protein BS47DRAFT_1393815 [Hydnum rufescens UP504]
MPFPKFLPLRSKNGGKSRTDVPEELEAHVPLNQGLGPPDESDFPDDRGSPDQEFIPTTKALLESSRFRALVVGKSGIGKSSLINAAFGVDLSETSDRHAGKHDVAHEIRSPLNNHLILHDSEGFGFGDNSTLRTVQEFIKKRSSKSIPLHDRLHAIWLCAEIPHAGGRVFERGDEEFLRDHTHDVSQILAVEVPIIVVFTKYDLFVMTKMKELAGSFDLMDFGWDKTMYDEHIRNLSVSAAAQAIGPLCEAPLRAVVPGNRHPWTKVSSRPKYEQTIEDLIEVTLNSIRGPIAEAVRQNPVDNLATHPGDINVERLLFAVAQRGSAEATIKASIEVGRLSMSLEKCLRTVHYDIIAVWNFHDPEKASHLFRSTVSELDDPHREGSQGRKYRHFVEEANLVVTTAISAASVFPPSVPVVLPVAGTMILASWVLGSFDTAHNSLRCLMGYIIAITMMMRSLFAMIRFRRKTVPISRAMVNLVVLKYSKSSHKKHIHEQIRAYVAKTALAVFKRNIAIDEISRLIGVDKCHELDAIVIAAAESLGQSSDEDWITSDQL